MPGIQLDMGLGSSVFTSGYPGASTPAAAGASPQGPTTIGQKAFGIVTGGSNGSKCAHIGLLSAGVLSIVGLVWVYYSLPR
jgi:hypothetical protein